MNVLIKRIGKTMPILEDKILNIFIIIEQLFACWNFWWLALLFRTDKKFSNNSIGGEKNKQKCSNGNICLFRENIFFDLNCPVVPFENILRWRIFIPLKIRFLTIRRQRYLTRWSQVRHKQEKWFALRREMEPGQGFS